MKSTLALVSYISLAAAQGVTSAISPSTSAPAGCQSSYNGQFEITVASVSSKRDIRDLHRRAECGGAGTLVISLSNGVLTDNMGRTGYIASNRQFQFDDPPQAGAIYTAGFSLCNNLALALGDSTTFYSCASGSFSNLYDQDWAAQCEPVEIFAMPCGASASDAPTTQGGQSSAGRPPSVSQLTDGQPQVTSQGPAVSQYTDGQPQVTSQGPAVSQYTDGQPQVTSQGPAVSQYTDGQPQVTSQGPAVSQYTDGQPQVTSQGPAVSQYTDGQPQVTSQGPAVSQYTDGQPQVTSQGPAVSQYTDGQPQVTSQGPAVSQYTDGQPQVTAAPVVSEYTDGQPQVTSQAPAVSEYTDGQPQVTSQAPAVSQYSDGQPQVTSAGTGAPGPSGVPSMPGGCLSGCGFNSTLSAQVSSSQGIPKTPSSSAPAPVSTSGAIAVAGRGIDTTSLGAFVVGLLGAIWAL